MTQCIKQLILLFGISSVTLLLPLTASAQSFDQAYLNWKAKQEAQDRKLQPHQYDRHYLAKPSVSNASQSFSSSAASGDKININQASVAELQQLHGIGQKKAEAIVAYRQQHGPFQQIEDLEKVKGIGPALLNKNRARMVR